MAQLTKGTTYSTGDTVTATNLNALVDNASLAPGAITDQTTASTVNTTDTLLINQSGTLKKATVSQITGTQPITGYVKSDGTVAMTGNLTIGTTPSATTHAATVGWVQGYATTSTWVQGYAINKAGDTGIGNLTMSGSLTLAGNPASNLVAAPKQYVDAAVSPLATQSSLSAHTSDTNNPHATTKAQVGLGNVDNTSDLLKPVSTATQTALNAKLDLAGGTLTGALGLPAGNPTVNNQAAHKAYVDSSVATKLGNTGPQTFTGDLTVASGWLSLSGTNPLSSTSVVTKSQIDAIPRIAAKCAFYTCSVGQTTTQATFYLTVVGSRPAGSSTLTINYATLPSKYKNAAKPFFLSKQFVGIVAATGVAAGLYEIQSTDFASTTFTVNTTATTAFSATIQLSLVYDNILEGDPSALNVKSIYWSPAAYSKYYVNFLSDTVSGSRTNESPSSVFTGIVAGSAPQASAGAALLVNATLCHNTWRSTYNENVNSPEGYGATSMGCHVGFFYAYNAGANTGLWNAAITIQY